MGWFVYDKSNIFLHVQLQVHMGRKEIYSRSADGRDCIITCRKSTFGIFSLVSNGMKKRDVTKEED